MPIALRGSRFFDLGSDLAVLFWLRCPITFRKNRHAAYPFRMKVSDPLRALIVNFPSPGKLNEAAPKF